ncbi:MAG: efflux RND transporter permease subunit [Candidatus Omnitrophica bacterium]|nr:efflux RND transporter permease subunit [Candidatus Omnitrophota bacterium]
MLKHIVALALELRFYVLVGAIIVSGYGMYTATQMPVDVFPDFNRPYVNIMVEARGYDPEEVERLISFPIASSMNGSPGVIGVRSSSGIGYAQVTVEFDWGMNIYLCRQIVQERLQLASEKLPEDITPTLAPASSITGEVLHIGLTSDGTVSPVELRTIADWVIRPRLLTVNGVAEVFTVGGAAKEYQVLVEPSLLAKYGVSLHEVEEALHGANTNTPGSFIYREGKELLVKNVGRSSDLSDIEELVIKSGQHGSIRLKEVASIREGEKISRGAAGVEGQDAVIINTLKQPAANTLALTAELDKTIDSIEESLPNGVTLTRNIYRQARFIETAIANVEEALRDGSILVVIVVALFLMSLRMSIIILVAIPLSFVTTFIVFSWLGMTINTMTLGGLAVAVGELVDCAIVGAENIYRRLRINLAKPREEREHFLPLIAHSTSEVFSAIVLGTAIVLLVITPLFALPGIVGRIFSPVGTAYVLSILSSMVVSLTVTPVLCSYLLRGKLPDTEKDGFVVGSLKKAIEPVVLGSVKLPVIVLGIAGILLVWLMFVGLSIGRDLLPPFNEGTITISAAAPPGTSLQEASKLAKAAEKAVKKVPEIAASKTGRWTGRAEGDEHIHEVNSSEIEAALITPEGQKPRPLEEIQHDIRAALEHVSGVVTDLSQPIQHLVSHLIGGARAQVIVKIFGPDLDELRRLGKEVHAQMKEVPGVVDDYLEQQALIPQIRIIPDRNELARYGLRLADVLSTLETALQGRVVSRIQEENAYFDLTVRGSDRLREEASNVGELYLNSPDGSMVPVKAVAQIKEVFGPNVINQENARRRIMVLCNVEGRDLASAVNGIEERVQENVEFPPGYTLEFGGQYEQLIEASQRIGWLSLFALLMIIVLLAAEFRAASLTTIVLLNIPQAMIGAVLALIITGTTLSMGAMVGFIALCGIASRNGILLISHWVNLLRERGGELDPPLILQGCKDRLTPVLMTALTTNLGLIPLVLSEGQPGKEILHPVAIVIFGGLCTSTILDFTVTPAAASLFGKRAIARLAKRSPKGTDDEHLLEEESLEIEKGITD